DLSVAPLGVDGATGLPTLGYANALLDVDRRDVLLGGDGKDVISAGTAETWVFGGAGNDVLTSGSDHNGGDLLWGGAGDDTFQVIPGPLPLTRPTAHSLNPADQVSFVPTFSDRYDGGAGNDRVLFLGGDLDPNGLPVPDNVAIRYNTLLHRYELTA